MRLKIHYTREPTASGCTYTEKADIDIDIGASEMDFIEAYAPGSARLIVEILDRFAKLKK